MLGICQSHTSDLRDSNEYKQKQLWGELIFTRQSSMRFDLVRCKSQADIAMFLLNPHIKKQIVYSWMSLKSELWSMRGPLAARMPTGAQFYYSNLFFLIDVGNLSFEYTGYVIKVITPPRQQRNKQRPVNCNTNFLSSLCWESAFVNFCQVAISAKHLHPPRVKSIEATLHYQINDQLKQKHTAIVE